MFFLKRKSAFERFMQKAKKMDAFDCAGFEDFVAECAENAPKVTPKKLGLKLIVLSDTHGDLAFGNRFEAFMETVKSYDLLIILGDIYSYELERIVKIVPTEKILALRGNHDSFDVYEPFGIRNINGKGVTYKGIKIAGLEGSFRYKNEAFPSYTQYESLLMAQKMPKNADILLSHDRMLQRGKYDLAHAGLAGIAHYIFQNGVQWHIHGHIHKSYRESYRNGTTEKSVYGIEFLEL